MQATRGGRVKLATITAPETDYNHPDKGDALHAMEIALALEKLNFQYLYKLHKVDGWLLMRCTTAVSVKGPCWLLYGQATALQLLSAVVYQQSK